ncbi:TetR/AcrR family transcriptional regulator [Streptomyces sp. NPDC048717]|uniref:TetR/AcrR family transcriptional regulator n=1 Tax=Streptomyces sp. NPDC048717 TaxID=3154928 RepID=UPI00343234C3
MAEGLRERKKRQTKQLISDMATGLFLERGFTSVTVAEIAEAADVSVNTVYNYFPAKEDMFLDRMEGVVQRLARMIRGRDAGESAARAVLREIRGHVGAVSPAYGLMAGFADFVRVIEDAPTLKARLYRVQQEVRQVTVDALREEAGVEAGDPMPFLVGGQICWIQETVVEFITAEMLAGRHPHEVSREALGLLDEIEELLGDAVLDYAVRVG